MNQEMIASTNAFEYLPGSIEFKNEDINEYTSKNGEDIITWRPQSRPFRFLKKIKNMKFSYSIKLYNKSIIFKVDTNYHKDVMNNIQNIRNHVQEVIVNELSSEFSSYTYTENMFYNGKLSICVNKVKKNSDDKFGNPLKVIIQEN